jgi:hypothetical protein
MKYICLGYIQPGKFENLSENERHAMLDECFDYDDKLRANGHFAAGEALQPPNVAMTLYWKNGKVAVTDGPYAETKEQLGGILVLEARDLNHAIQLISQHPGVKYGPWEIRPAADLNDMIRESERRRKGTGRWAFTSAALAQERPPSSRNYNKKETTVKQDETIRSQEERQARGPANDRLEVLIGKWINVGKTEPIGDEPPLDRR